MTTYRIALYPGDGIGPEVISQAVRVLEAACGRQGGISLELVEFPWGYAYYQRHGRLVPEDYLEQLAPFHAILLGALGWPPGLPDHLTLAPLVRLRQAFDQYACVRPARLLPGLTCVLAEKGPQHIDLVVVRENSEGEYVDIGGRLRPEREDELAVQTALHTRRGVERIMRFAFELATSRRGRMTMVTKSNAQRFAYRLWDEVLLRLAPEYPQVEAERQHADAAVMNLVRMPEHFDVIVASNLFGDILTDLAGLLAGGLGLAPSANLNPQRTFPSMFEPVHGSAPDIAGQGIANPTAAILSAAMMLEWLGERQPAAAIQGAVERTLAAGYRTRDLGGSLSAQAFTDRVLDAL